MAEVTVNSRKFNVDGSMRENFYNITGNTGDTLTVGMFSVKMVTAKGNLLTSFSVAPGANGGQSVITLTGTLGTNVELAVTGT